MHVCVCGCECVRVCVCGYVGTGLQEGQGDELMQRLRETQVWVCVCESMRVCVECV